MCAGSLPTVVDRGHVAPRIEVGAAAGLAVTGSTATTAAMRWATTATVIVSSPVAASFPLALLGSAARCARTVSRPGAVATRCPLRPVRCSSSPLPASP